MVHMWVNTVTGCGLPRKEINGLWFGPWWTDATRRPGSSVLVRGCALVLLQLSYTLVHNRTQSYTCAHGARPKGMGASIGIDWRSIWWSRAYSSP